MAFAQHRVSTSGPGIDHELSARRGIGLRPARGVRMTAYSLSRNTKSVTGNNDSAWPIVVDVDHQAKGCVRRHHKLCGRKLVSFDPNKATDRIGERWIRRGTCSQENEQADRNHSQQKRQHSNPQTGR